MFVTELDSFVYKFHQLWSAGHSAHLDLDTHAGRAWVGLRVQLGHHAPLHPYHLPNNFPQYSHKKDSPSRQRRRAKRAAAAQQPNAAEEASEMDKEVTVDVANNKTAEEANVHESRNIYYAKPVEETEEGQNDTLVDVAEEASKAMRIPDEVCADDDYEPAPIEEIRADEVQDHKVTNSPIPQIDGLDSLERVDETTGVVHNNVKLKNQYPRNCESCEKYLKNKLDFRKHIVACVMSRK